MDSESRPTLYVYWAAFVASLGGFLQSYVTCAIAGSLAFIAGEFSLNAFHQGHLASIILFGALVGSCFAGFLADRLGRRRSLQSAAFLFFASSVGMFFSTSFSLLLLYRFVAGIATGISAILVPLYLVEIAPNSKRGAFVTVFQFAVTVGTLAAYLVNLAFEGSGHWRAMLGFGAPIALFQFLALFVFPESPVWLSGTEKPSGNLKAFLPLLFVGFLLSVFQQLSGINAVIYFSPKIFAEGGLARPMLSTLLVGVINILATFGSLLLIDRWGRRKLLLLSQGGVLLSLLIIILAFATESSFVDLLAVGGVLTYVASYSLGMGPVTWVLISEIYPFEIRAKAMAVMTFLSWLTNYLIVLTFPPLLAGWGSTITFSLYFLFGVLGFFLFFRFVPETKNENL